MPEPLELLGEGLRVGGRDQHAVHVVRDDVAVAGDVRCDRRRPRGHALDQDHAEALAGERGGAEDVGLAERAPEDTVADLAEHVHPLLDGGVGDPARDLLGVGADHGQAARHVLDQRLERGQQDRQALALLGAADEQQAQVVGLGLRALGRRLDVDPVGDDRVLPAEPAARRPLGRLRDGDARGELVEDAAGAKQRGGVVRGRLGRVGVEGADDRRAPEGRGVPRDQRRGRLVDVHHVEVARLQLAAHPHQPVGERHEVGDRAVGAEADRAPERHQVVRLVAHLGRGGAVQATREPSRRIPWCQHADVIPARQELLGQRLDVPVHAPLIGPGIGRNEGYAHRSRVPAQSGPAAALGRAERAYWE
jgi:hypothetical protein